MMQVLAAMSLTTTAMLGGLGLIALPIAAHLLNRRVRRQIVFPTIQLLRATAASQAQLFQLRRWLLLVLRCAAVALIVLAFARPMWHAAGDVDAGGGAVVVVADVSASAGQRAGGPSAWELLGNSLSEMLGGLVGEGGEVNLVVADARPHAVFDQMVRNVDVVRDELGRLAPTHERADLVGAIGLAGRLLGEHGGRGRLVIVSDLQRSNWEDVAAQIDADEAVPRGTAVTIVRLDESEPGNLALSDATIHRSRVLVGEATVLSVRLTNHGGEMAETTVRMWVDDAVMGSQSVSIRPGEAREILFPYRFGAMRDHAVAFSVGDDGLAADNRAYLSVRPTGRVPIVLVGDDDPDEAGTASYFLMRALVPHVGEGNRHGVRHVRSWELTKSALTGAAVVVLSDTERMDPEAIAGLGDHLMRGGNVLGFCGQGATVRNLRALDEAHEASVLPWPIGAPRGFDRRAEALRFAADVTDSTLAGLDARSLMALGQIHFYHVWSTGRPHAEARVMLRFNDGAAALGGRDVGLGRMWVANFSPALSDSDLGKYGSFVALVHAAVEDLTENSSRAPVAIAGRSGVFTADLPSDGSETAMYVLDPMDRLVADGRVLVEGDGLAVHVDRLRMTGFYTWATGDGVVGRGAVNLDPRESDLRRVDGADLAAQFAGSGMDVQVRQRDDMAASGARGGRPLWGWMIAAAAALLAVELAVLSWWHR